MVLEAMEGPEPQADLATVAVREVLEAMAGRATTRAQLRTSKVASGQMAQEALVAQEVREAPEARAARVVLQGRAAIPLGNFAGSSAAWPKH